MKSVVLVARAHAGAVIPAGAVVGELTPDQVRRRKHKLEPVEAPEGEKAPPLTVAARALEPLTFKAKEKVRVLESLLPQLAPNDWADEKGKTLAEIAFAAKIAQREAEAKARAEAEKKAAKEKAEAEKAAKAEAEKAAKAEAEKAAKEKK